MTSPSEWERCNPAALRKEERELLDARRKCAGVEALPSDADAAEDPVAVGLVGIGLSGGGIRSATQSLGFFQALSRRGLLPVVDYLSTVSGGGYFGSCLGRLFSRGRTAAEVQDELARDGHTVAYLRNHGNYLAPHGSGDAILAIAILLRNWLATLTVASTLVLLVFVAVRLTVTLLHPDSTPADWIVGGLPINGMTVLGALMLLLWTLPLAIAWWYVRWVRPESRPKDPDAASSTGPDPTSPPDGRESRSGSEKKLQPAARLSPKVALRRLMLALAWSCGALIAGIAVALLPIDPLPQVWTVGGLPASPLLLLGGAGLLLWAAPWGIAYWFIRWRREERWQPKSGGLWQALGWIAAVLRWIPYLVLVLPALGWLLKWSLGRRNLPEPEHRNVASRRLSLAIMCSGGVLLLGLADSAGALLHASVTAGDWGWLASAVTAVTAVAAGARKIAASVGPTAEGGWKARLGSLVMPVVAFAVAGVGLGLCSLASFAVAVNGLPALPPGNANLASLLVVLGVLAILCVTFRSKWSFVNRSSFHPFYWARITRAFLGASNRARHKGSAEPSKKAEPPKVRSCHDEDDLEMADYAPHASGGPLHLINVTVNETLIGRSGLQHVRSRGVGMAVGPAGLSVAARHHALWQPGSRGDHVRFLQPVAGGDGFQVFTPEEHQEHITCEGLTLGQWTAISGAAASTGMGSGTSLPKSLLMGLFNVRLGYWWDSGVGRPPITAVQQALLGNEYLARFPGVARRQWNLSDGGHFENLAGYELLRRRLPVMLICDFEQDEGYTFSGLGNLVRKARIDFGADIRFVRGGELDALVGAPVRRWFGSLEELRRGRWDEEPVTDPVTGERRQRLEAAQARTSRARFALAHVKYRDGMGGSGKAPGESWLIYVKPTLLGDEPADLRQYHGAHPAFPHESTSDQFFDEAQWESYRRLGEHLGSKLFAAKKGAGGAGVPADWLTRGWVIDAPYQPPSATAGPAAKAKNKAAKQKTAKQKTVKQKTVKKPPAP